MIQIVTPPVATPFPRVITRGLIEARRGGPPGGDFTSRFHRAVRNKPVRGAWSRKLAPPKGVIVVGGVSRSLRGVARIAARNSKPERVDQP